MAIPGLTARSGAVLAAGFLVMFVGGGSRFAIGLTLKPMVEELELEPRHPRPRSRSLPHRIGLMHVLFRPSGRPVRRPRRARIRSRDRRCRHRRDEPGPDAMAGLPALWRHLRHRQRHCLDNPGRRDGEPLVPGPHRICQFARRVRCRRRPAGHDRRARRRPRADWLAFRLRLARGRQHRSGAVW